MSIIIFQSEGDHNNIINSLKKVLENFSNNNIKKFYTTDYKTINIGEYYYYMVLIKTPFNDGKITKKIYQMSIKKGLKNNGYKEEIIFIEYRDIFERLFDVSTKHININ